MSTAVTSTVITGGRVIDQLGERRADVRIDADGRIDAVEEGLRGDRVLHADGCVVCPGFVDLHTHLRQPGQEEAETIETGSRGAVLGGYTALVAMPNTQPAMDNASTVKEVIELGQAALCDVYPTGTMTIGRAGEALSPMAELVDLGVRIFTDDGTGLQDARLMRRVMEYASGLEGRAGRPIVLAQHCEVSALSEGGYMHEGTWSSRLGIPGQPAEAEELMVMRDIALARRTGVHVHFQHLSTAGSVAMVRAAKAGGLSVTAEATTHHFTLTDAACASYDPVFKVHPPLRTDGDVAAIRAGLADGTIDAIATDHAPHAPETKDQSFADAPPGMLGLETALALTLSELDIDLATAIGLLSWKPAAIAGLSETHGVPIEPGRLANLTVFDPNASWTVAGKAMASRSSNTPYEGRTVRGKVRHTIARGEVVVDEGVAQR